MPNIRQYDNPVAGLQSDERGVDAAAQVARRAPAAFNAAADAVTTVGNQGARMADTSIRDAGAVAVDYMQHREISQGAAAWATLNDQLTQKWNDTAKNADPNDPTVAAKFREEVLNPTLEKFGQSFLTEGGQKWAEGRVESTRNHLFEKSAADMGSLAADAVAVNVRQTSNALSNTAMTDPSSVPHLLEGIEGTIGAMVDSSPNLKGAAASKARMQLTEKMREEIVKAGAIGAIQKAGDPEAEAAKWGEKYPQYINGADLKILSSNARQQIRADRQDQAYTEHLRKQDEQDRSDKTETGYLQKLYSGDPKDLASVSSKAIVNDPNLNRVAKERMLNVVNRELKPETDAKTSAQSSVEIMRKMRDPDVDQREISKMIFDARVKDPGTPGSINKTDMADLQKQLLDLKTPEGAALAADRNEFFKRYAPTIDGALADGGLHSALGSQKMYEAEKAAKRQEDVLRKQGKDPHLLYDPTSPEFFGKPANIMKYHASMQEDINYRKGAPKAAAAASTNLTANDSVVTGVQTTPLFSPPANWEYSPSRNQYRDKAGQVYDAKGNPVK